MTSPTLELSVKASGIDQVKMLGDALALLNGEAGKLRGLKAALSPLQEIQRELAGLRKDVTDGVAAIAKALSGGMGDAFKTGVKAAQAGAVEMRKAFEESLKKISADIAKSGEDRAKKLMEANGSMRSAGEAQGKAFAQGVQEGVAKTRLSYSVPLAGGARAGISTNGMGNFDALMAEASKVKQGTQAVAAEYAKSISMLEKSVAATMRAATQGPNTLRGSGYIAWWEKVLADQAQAQAALEREYAKSISMLEKSVAATMRAATVTPSRTGYVKWWEQAIKEIDAGATMMDQAVRQFRARQEAAFNASVQGSVGQAMSSAGAYSSIGSNRGALHEGIKEAGEAAGPATTKVRQLAEAVGLFHKNAGDAHSAARGLASGFGLLWLSWGNMLPLLAGAAVSHAFAQMIKMGADVQQNMETIRVLSEETTVSVANLNKQMLELARTGPFGPREIADAMKTLSLAGLDIKDVSSSIKDVLNFAVAGTTTIQNSADVLTTVGVAFGISAKNYNYIGDVIAKAAAISKASVEDIGASFKTASVINRQFGASLEDVGLGLALLTNSGVKASMAGTSLRNMYVDILGRTPKVQNSLKALGLEADFAFDKMTGKARPVLDIFKDLFEALSKIDKVGQTKAQQAIFSDRGERSGINFIETLKTASITAQNEAQKNGTTFAVELRKQLQLVKKEFDESAGFMAISAAQMSLTSANQMKSVTATLQASLVASFDSLQPYLLTTAQRLKEIFNSSEFQSGIQRVAVAVSSLTVFFVEHVSAILAVSAALLTLKVAGLVGLLLEGFASRVVAVTAALWSEKAATDVAAAAKIKYAAASEAAAGATSAQATATAAASTAASGFASVLGTALFWGSRLLIWLTAAYTAWQLYSFWTDKSKDSAKQKVDQSGPLIDALRSEAQRLEDINAAKALGISLDELQARRKVANIRDDSGGLPGDALRQRAAQLESGSRSSGGNAFASLTAQQLRQEAADADRSAFRRSEILSRTVDVEVARIKTASQEAADQVKAELAARAKGIPGVTYGDGSFTVPGRDKKAKGEGIMGMLTSEAASAMAEATRVESVLRTSYENQLRLLDQRHRAELVSEGEYQASTLQLTTTYEGKATAALQEAGVARLDVYRKQTAAAEANLKKGAYTQQQYDEKVIQLKDKYVADSEKLSSDLDKIEDAAKTRREASVIAEDGATQKLLRSNDDYWRKVDNGLRKESAAAEARHQLANATEEVRVRGEAEAKFEEGHQDEIQKLTTAYEKATVARDEFLSKFNGPMQGDAQNDEVYQALAALQKRIEVSAGALQAAKAAIDLYKGRAGDNAVTEARNKADEELRKQATSEAKSLSKTWADAILSGGKDGGKKLWQSLKQMFLSPISIVLQATLQPLANTVVNAGYSMLGMGNMVTGAVGGGSGLTAASNGLSAAGSLGSIGSALFGGGVLSGAGGAFGGMASATLSNGLIGGFAANMANIGTAAAGGEMMAALGAAMPYLAPIALIAALAFSGHKGGPKIDGHYGVVPPGGVGYADNQGLASGAKDTVKALQASYTAITRGTGGPAVNFGLGLSTDPAGTSPSFIQASYTRGTDTALAYDHANLNAPRDEAAFKSAVEEETTKALFSALKDSNLSEAMKRMLGTGEDLEAMKTGIDRVTAARQIESDMLKLQSTAYENLLRTRQDELDGADALTKELLQQKYALEDLAQRKTLEERLTAAQSTASERAAAARQKELDAIVPMNRALAETAQTAERVQSASDRARSLVTQFVPEDQVPTVLATQINERLVEAGFHSTVEMILRTTKAQFVKVFQDMAAGGNIDGVEAMLDVANSFLELQKPAEEAAKKLQEVQAALVDLGKGLYFFVRDLKADRSGTIAPWLRADATKNNYQSDLSLARGGDQDALQRIQTSANAYIDAQKTLTASGSDTQAVIDQVISDLSNLPAVQTYQQQSLNLLTSLVGALNSLPDALAPMIGANFDKIDTNLDGKLTFTELQTALQGKATDAQIRGLMELVDTNGDGVLSKLEVQNALGGQATNALNQLVATLVPSILASFDKIDTNLDGKLTFAELQAGLQGKATDAQITQLMNLTGSGITGTLSKLDLTNLQGGQGVSQLTQLTQLAQTLAPVLTANFDKIDTNLDGKLTFAELQTALQGKATDAQILQLLGVLDADGDGTISRLELLNAVSGQSNGSLAGILQRLSGDSLLAYSASAVAAIYLSIAQGAQGAAYYTSLTANYTLVTAQLVSSTNAWLSIIHDDLTSGRQLMQFRRDAVVGGWYATGASFNQGVVTRPSMLAGLGEAGPEGVLPLANVGGYLGVRYAGSGGSADDSVNRGVVLMQQHMERLVVVMETLLRHSVAANGAQLSVQREMADGIRESVAQQKVTSNRVVPRGVIRS